MMAESYTSDAADIRFLVHDMRSCSVCFRRIYHDEKAHRIVDNDDESTIFICQYCWCE
jgi:hypothetical protein